MGAVKRDHAMRREFVLAAILAALGLAPVAAADPVTVELFTSQGCSSCPPANANLAAIADRPDILALSFGVTYWDQLGWKDTFAQDKFTRRQYAYARPLGHSGPFTPQIVVNGAADGTGITRAELTGLVSRAAHPTGPAIAFWDGGVAIGVGKPGADADIWLVRYDPRTVNVAVLAGENSGVTLAHRNVVKNLVRLGSWRGTAVSLALPSASPGLSTAILVQGANGGPILAAAKQ
jgi:hypothetical protein